MRNKCDKCDKCGNDLIDGAGCMNPNCLREWFEEIEAKYFLSGMDDISEEEVAFLIQLLRESHDMETQNMQRLALAQQDSAKYYQLLRLVGNKHPGESRHETAIRYLRSAEMQAHAGREE